MVSCCPHGLNDQQIGGGTNYLLTGMILQVNTNKKMIDFAVAVPGSSSLEGVEGEKSKVRLLDFWMKRMMPGEQKDPREAAHVPSV